MNFNSFTPKTAAKMSLLLLLSACTSTGTGTNDVLGSASSPSTTVQAPVSELSDPRAYCPKTSLRAGTETMRVYPEGVDSEDEDARNKLRFQAVIHEVVRECNYVANTLSMRIGIAGRVINGPTGEAGSIELPIRVAVTRGDEVLYSQLHKIAAVIEPGKSLAAFRFVDEAIAIDKPDRKNIIIQIGFDEGAEEKSDS